MNLLDELQALNPDIPRETLEGILLYCEGRTISHATIERDSKRRRAVEAWDKGGSTTTQLAERFGVGERTMRRWINGR